MRYLITILTIVLLASCSVKKRTYRDGYYIDWAFQKKTSTPNTKTVSEKHINLPVKEVIETEYVTASKRSDPVTESFVVTQMKVVLMDTCGDVITFRSGDQVTARVTEITEDKIKYKRCDNLDGPVFVVNKGTVATIRYANGVVEKIEAPKADYSKLNDPNQYTFKGPKRMHPKAIWSLVCLIPGVFFSLLLIPAYILSYTAIKEIDAKPDVYKGRQLAKIVKGICVGIALFILFILVLVLISM